MLLPRVLLRHGRVDDPKPVISEGHSPLDSTDVISRTIIGDSNVCEIPVPFALAGGCSASKKRVLCTLEEHDLGCIRFIRLSNL